MSPSTRRRRTPLPQPLPSPDPADEVVASPTLQLRLRHSEIGARRLSLKPGQSIVVGRGGPGVHLAMTWDHHASRRHARIQVSQGRLQIEDLGSRNGTFIDGVQIEGVRLFEPLQDLCIGATRFEILNGPDGEAPDPTVTDELALPPVAPRRATAVARRQDTVDFRPPPREPPPPSAPPRPARAHPAKDAVLERIARFLAHAETKDYYGALDVAEDAEASLITEKLNSYRAFIREATVMLGEQEPRVATAATRLQRMETVLTQGRLDFDFSRDIVRAEARWAEAKQGQGPSLETLRATWVRVHPERVKEARALAADAARLRKQGRLPDAVRKGRRALLADPFSAELRDRVEFWQNLQSAQR